jgi:hypothetical protein
MYIYTYSVYIYTYIESIIHIQKIYSSENMSIPVCSQKSRNIYKSTNVSDLYIIIHVYEIRKIVNM